MATTTPNFGWVVPTSTDLVKDGATAIETLGDSIDASLLDLKGGTSGQVLSKNSNTDMDFVWVAQDDSNAIQNAIVDAKGDVIAATAADTPARLAVGTNGQVLTADSTAATGLKWATPASGSSYVGAIAYGAVNLSWSSTATAVSSLTTEIVDTDNFHSTATNTSRMTIPAGKDGKYLMQMDMNLAATGGSSPNMFLMAYKNGAAITEGIVNGKLASFLSAQAQDAHWQAALVVTGVATDYFEFFVIMGGGSSTIDKARYSFTYLGA
jgi:hypothetical protein